MPRKLPEAAKKHQFKKGQSGNPLGGKIHSPLRRALKNLTIDVYREVIELALTNNLQSLKELIEDEDTPAIQVGVAACLMKAITNGDYRTVEQLAERIVGKIPEELNLNLPKPVTIQITHADLKKAIKELEDEY